MVRLPVATFITLALLVLSLTLLAVIYHVTPSQTASSTRMSLIEANWQYMPGVHRIRNGLTVSPTDFRIVTQDGTASQPNPPVNLYGTHLQITGKGNFTTTLQVSDRQADASLQLYNSPPLIADEFRIEPASLRLTLSDGHIHIIIMDGSTQSNLQRPNAVYEHSYAINSSPTTQLTIVRNGSTILVRVGDQQIASLPFGHLFASGQLWIGLDSVSGTFSIPTFTVQGTDGGKLQLINTTDQVTHSMNGGLQQLASTHRPGFLVGTALALAPMVSDQTYAQLAASNFGIVTLENAMKAQFISPRQGEYNFQEADALVAAAHKNGQLVHGHAIAFSEAEPQWMRNLPINTPAEANASGAVLLDYARTVASHFNNDLDSLDVINEPLVTTDGTDLQKNIWYKTLGPNYAAKVLATVHAAAPRVKLYINENGTEQPGARQEAFFAYIKQLKNAGTPLYGVGLQAHVYDKSSDILYPEDITAVINRYKTVGLKVRISEMDVPADAKYSAYDPEAGSGLQYQAWQFSSVAQACITNSNCVGFSVWGVTDKYDMYLSNNDSVAYGHDLLFNLNGNPTDAYRSIRNVFQKSN